MFEMNRGRYAIRQTTYPAATTRGATTMNGAARSRIPTNRLTHRRERPATLGRAGDRRRVGRSVPGYVAVLEVAALAAGDGEHVGRRHAEIDPALPQAVVPDDDRPPDP